MNPSSSQGTQCVRQDFSSRRRHGYIPAERIHVRISGHTGRILGSYLRDIFQPRYSSFVAMTQLKNYISQPCLIESIYAIFRVILFNFYEYLPMGVINVYFCWQCSQSSLLFIFCRLLSIGCATALPMGVAPEAIAEIFGYRLKRIDKLAPYTSSCIICRFYSLLNGFFPYVRCKPPSQRRGKLVRLDRYFLILCSLLFFIRVIFLDTLTPLCYLHCKKSRSLLWALPLQGPISTCL
jgi:hypothetical protein